MELSCCPSRVYEEVIGVACTGCKFLGRAAPFGKERFSLTFDLKTQARAHVVELATIAAMTAIVVVVLVFGGLKTASFRMFAKNGITYPVATVTRIVSEDVAEEEGTGRYLGSQKVEVRIEDGVNAGKTVVAFNQMSADHNVLARVGEKLIVQAENQEGLEPHYSIYNYDRIPGIAAIVGVFALSMVLVGRTKGLRSLLGLAFSLFMIVMFLLPLMFNGVSPILASLLTAAIITVCSMLLLNGGSRKTAAGIASTLLGLLAATLVYLAIAAVLQVSGFNDEGAEELVILQQSTGVQVQQVLFAGVLVASLGAVMDMCMSIASSLFELKQVHTELTARQMVASAFSIGGDMIGTMCQTLIMAFAGAGISSLLLLLAYGIDFNQFMTSDYLAVELIHSFVGAIAVVLCVPITALVSAWQFEGASLRGSRTA